MVKTTIDLQQLQVACDWIEQSGLQAQLDDGLFFVSSYLIQETEIEDVIVQRIPHFKRKSLFFNDFPWIQRTYVNALCDFIGPTAEEVFRDGSTGGVELCYVNPWLMSG